MKDSIQAHNDYAENVLPKLKRAYLKKCQDVEVRAPHILPCTVDRSQSTNLPGPQICRPLGGVAREIRPPSS